MSVLACQRPGCDEIMCDLLIIGNYLCDDCLDELKKYKKTWSDETQPNDVKKLIKDFLNTEKDTYGSSIDDPEERARIVQRVFNDMIGNGVWDE